MEQVIQRLIAAREKAKLSLEDIHAKTKIPMRQLEYIETAQLDKIGPAVYVRGFMRRYAQAVGLDPDSLWEEERAQAPALPARSVHSGRKAKRLNFSPVLRVLTIIALIAIVGFLLWSAILNFLEPAPPAPPDVPPQDQPDPGTDPVPEPPQPELEVEKVQEDGTGAVYVVRNAEQLDVLLTFSGKCWTRITADGVKLKEATYTKDKQEQLSGAGLYLIRFGAPRYVSVTINGVAIETPDILKGYNLEIRLEQQSQ